MRTQKFCCTPAASGPHRGEINFNQLPWALSAQQPSLSCTVHALLTCTAAHQNSWATSSSYRHYMHKSKSHLIVKGLQRADRPAGASRSQLPSQSAAYMLINHLFYMAYTAGDTGRAQTCITLQGDWYSRARTVCKVCTANCKHIWCLSSAGPGPNARETHHLLLANARVFSI